MRPEPDSTKTTPQVLLLAPSAGGVPAMFLRRHTDSTLHRRYLDGLQRLRGRLYLEDGAIHEWQLTADGRHEAYADDQSWHVILADGPDRVSGCARYRSHANTASFEELGVSDSALARSPRWGGWMRLAVEAQLALARRRNVAYVEVGGWALARELRCTSAALRVVLTTYALGALLGGCIAIGTCTRRNGSASILRRLGARPLEMDGTMAPAYFDPGYGCEMEMLTFDSAVSSPRLGDWLARMRSELVTMPVLSARTADDSTRILLTEAA